MNLATSLQQSGSTVGTDGRSVAVFPWGKDLDHAIREDEPVDSVSELRRKT
jgi:hypothetical protein